MEVHAGNEEENVVGIGPVKDETEDIVEEVDSRYETGMVIGADGVAQPYEDLRPAELGETETKINEKDSEMSSETVHKPEGGDTEPASGTPLEATPEDSDSSYTSTPQDPSYEPSQTEKHKQSKVCCICKKLLPKSYSMQVHMRSHSDLRPHKCPHCGQMFKNINDMRKHIVKIVCKVLRAEPEEAQAQVHALTHSPLHCTECSRMFADPEKLDRHKLVHKPLKCTMCEDSFNGVKPLKKHYLDVHKFSGPFLCTYCEKTYTDLAALLRHERTHTGDLPYQCSYCPRNMSSLTRHDLIHTQERPFKCTESVQCREQGATAPLQPQEHPDGLYHHLQPQGSPECGLVSPTHHRGHTACSPGYLQHPVKKIIKDLSHPSHGLFTPLPPTTGFSKLSPWDPKGCTFRFLG
uniref:C2H2-type domain-containing protein n=1 Tax=Hucho hucho TaxID=62062 RepID=A0A4W5LJ27_9TELE